MQAINCVKGEIHNVLTALRLNSSARRNSYYLHHDDSMEEPLMRCLRDLHETLGQAVYLTHVDTRTVLDPFLKVISSPYIAATVTLTALQSVHKFLVYQHIHNDSPEVQAALSEVVRCMTHCRFDTNSWEDAEAVYMKSMEVLMECLRSSAGYLLTDSAVCSMVKECFRIRGRSGSSKLLRTYAENMASQMVLIVFARISPETTTGGAQIVGPLPTSSLYSPTPKSRSHSDINGRVEPLSLDNKSPRRSPRLVSHNNNFNNNNNNNSNPYGEEALLRIFWFITNLINPTRELEDRILGLRLLRIVFETAGQSIGDFPSLVKVVQDEVCKHLLQNTQEKDLTTLSLCLRVVFDLFNTVKQHLKVQLEVFFTSIHLRIGESNTSLYEQKELVLESLVEFCKEPSLIVGLYRNYDCEVGSTNLFEDLCSFLASGSIPSQGVLQPLNILSLEAILGVVDSISKRFCDSIEHDSRPTTPFGTPLSPTTTTINNEDEANAIMKSRQKKKTLQVAAERFNRDGKDSFQYLKSIKILTNEPPSVEWIDSMVNFLRFTPHLDKTKIGEILGSHKPLNRNILQAYVNSFDFSISFERRTSNDLLAIENIHNNNNNNNNNENNNISLISSSSSTTTTVSIEKINDVRIDEALRVFLESFRLPGEAQQIERIMECFATRYFEQQSNGPLKSADAAFVLAYSVIMLNTDAHNPQVKHKMTKEAFCRNNRGINMGEDLPEEYLSDIYNSITANEIRMQSNDVRDMNDARFTHRWHNVVQRSLTTGPFQTHAPNIHGKEMFSLVWEKALHIFHHYLQQRPRATSEIEYRQEAKILHKLIEGFHTLSRICAFYSLNDILNKMVITLCNGVNGYFEQIYSSYGQDTKEVVMHFGRNRRARRITILLFNLVVGYGSEHITDGWPNILQCLLWMHKLRLLPDEFVELDDFTDSSGHPLPSLRLSTMNDNDQIQNENNSVGSILSSAFSLIFSNNNNNNNEIMDHNNNNDEQIMNNDIGDSSSETESDEIMLARLARDCIDSCQITELFHCTRFFLPHALHHLLQSLILVSTYASKSLDLNSTPVGLEIFPQTIMDEESAVWCLERICEIVERNQQRLITEPKIWSLVHSHIETALKNAPNEPNFYIERVIVNVLRFSVRLLPNIELTQRLLILYQLFINLSNPVLITMGERIITGIHIFVKTHGDNIQSIHDWKLVIDLIGRWRHYNKTGQIGFESLCFIIENNLSYKNYALCLELIMAFANVSNDNTIQPKHCLDQMLVLYRCLSIDNVVASDMKEENINDNNEQTRNDWSNDYARATERRRGELWLLIIDAMIKLCHTDREFVQIYALNTLQQALLASGVEVKSPHSWQECFLKYLLPLLHDLHEQYVNKKKNIQSGIPRDPRASVYKITTIIFQTFLHNLTMLAAIPDFHVFWLKFLAAIERFLTTESGGGFSDHFSESLKNLLLVMQTTNVFVNITKRTGQDLRALTWAIIERTQPDLKKNLEQALLTSLRTPDDN